MSFAIIVAVIALFVAMIALWLVSDVIKKVENQNAQFVDAHIRTVRADISDTEHHVRELTRVVKALDERLAGIEVRFDKKSGDLKDLKSATVQIEQQLDLLDRSIPKRYRAQVAPKATDSKTVQ